MKRPLLIALIVAIAAFIPGWAYRLGEHEGREITGAYLRAAYDREAELRTVILLQRVQLQRARLLACAEGARRVD